MFWRSNVRGDEPGAACLARAGNLLLLALCLTGCLRSRVPLEHHDRDDSAKTVELPRADVVRAEHAVIEAMMAPCVIPEPSLLCALQRLPRQHPRLATASAHPEKGAPRACPPRPNRRELERPVVYVATRKLAAAARRCYPSAARRRTACCRGRCPCPGWPAATRCPWSSGRCLDAAQRGCLAGHPGVEPAARVGDDPRRIPPGTHWPRGRGRHATPAAPGGRGGQARDGAARR